MLVGVASLGFGVTSTDGDIFSQESERTFGTVGIEDRYRALQQPTKRKNKKSTKRMTGVDEDFLGCLQIANVG